MPNFVYFDTDAFHRIGATFADRGLDPKLRDRILVSPITMLEVLSHLTLKNNSEILTHIKAVHNWLNPKRAGLLAWPTDAIARIGFQLEPEADDFTKRIEKTINLCLATESPEELRDSASKLKDALDRMKDSSLSDFNRLVEACRKEPLTPERFSEIWLYGIAKRTKADPKSRSIADVISSLSAYHEYEEQKLMTAVKNPQHKSDKNDIMDSEQLPYLGDPKLNFLTCDKGYAARVKNSSQLNRMVALSELEGVQQVEDLLQTITT